MRTNRAEVAVIGGGILGTAAAYELALAGAQVVLFERRAMASGTTGGSAGVVCLHDMGELYAVMSLIGYDRVRRLQREQGFSFNQHGALHYWLDGEPEPVESAFAAAYGSGTDGIYHNERLTRGQLRARFPWVPDAAAGAVVHPNQGYINPYELVDLYVRLGAATGRLSVMPGTPVLTMGHDGNRVERLVTRRGVWEVDTVVNAAGPWGAKVAGLAGTAVDLVPQRIQVAVATGFQDGVTGMPLVGWPGEVDGERGWCRGEDGDMLLFGQHRHLPDPLHTVDPDFVDMANDETYPGRVADLVRRHWKLPTAQFLPGWNCIYGSTPDGYPILGADVNLQNLVHVLGCNGHGITLHAGLAQAVAALVLRRSSTLRLDDVPGAPPVLDVSWLTQKRFTNGNLLSFDFERPSPCEDLIAREQIEGKAP